MTIRITLPAAWDAFRGEANKKDSTRNDQCWEGEIGRASCRERVSTIV